MVISSSKFFLKLLKHVNDQSFSALLDEMDSKSDFFVCPGIKDGYLGVQNDLK